MINLDACSSLGRLDASANSLTAVDGIAAATTLRWLSLANNAIEDITPLRDLDRLEVLNVAHNRLQGKVAAGRLRCLKALILNNNEITSVGGLEKLHDLDALVLSHNRLASLSGWLAGAAALKKLSLSHNPLLTDVGGALRSCTALQELRLNHCGLTALPADLQKNQRLRILEAGGNAIATLEDLAVLGELPSLRQLNLKGCPAAALPGYSQHILQLAPHLEVLDGRKLSAASFAGEKRGGKATADAAPISREAVGTGGEKSTKRKAAVEGPAVEGPAGEREQRKKRKKEGPPALQLGAVPAVQHQRPPPAAAAVYPSSDEADDAVAFAAVRRTAPKVDPSRTGVVKVVEVSNARGSGRGDKGKAKGKKGGGGVRGTAALRALMGTGEAGNAQPGWD